MYSYDLKNHETEYYNGSSFVYFYIEAIATTNRKSFLRYQTRAEFTEKRSTCLPIKTATYISNTAMLTRKNISRILRRCEMKLTLKNLNNLKITATPLQKRVIEHSVIEKPILY